MCAPECVCVCVWGGGPQVSVSRAGEASLRRGTAPVLREEPGRVAPAALGAFFGSSSTDNATGRKVRADGESGPHEDCLRTWTGGGEASAGGIWGSDRGQRCPRVPALGASHCRGSRTGGQQRAPSWKSWRPEAQALPPLLCGCGQSRSLWFHLQLVGSG